MLKYLIDDHPAGWSFLGMPVSEGGDTDYKMPAGYISDHTSLYEKKPNGDADWSKPIPHGPRCFCHGDRSIESSVIASTESPDGLQWAYVIDPGARTMRVLKAFYALDGNATYWQEVSVVDLDGPAPKWEFVECGEKLERCTHYAWKHFPELNGTIMNGLNTAKFIGTKPLEIDDAYAFEISGGLYQRTKNGSQVVSTRTGNKLWAEMLKPLNGAPILTASGAKEFSSRFAGMKYELTSDGNFWYSVFGYAKEGGHKQLSGVKPIYPPTLREPLEVFAALRGSQQPGNAPDNSSEKFEAYARFTSTRKFRDED
jgi:hypothetical protein